MDKQWFGVGMTKELAEEFKLYLRESWIPFEPSSCYDNIHFECYVDVNSNELERINEWIDQHRQN